MSTEAAAETTSTAPGAAVDPAEPTAPGPSRGRRLLRHRGLRWLAGALVVAALMLTAVITVIGSAGQRQADDPRSPIPRGAGALGQLLTDEGVQIETVRRTGEALDRLGPDATLVVADPQLVEADAARRLLGAGAARVVLLRPGTPGLQRFGVRATAVAADAGTFEGACAAPAAARAGTVLIRDARAFYRPSGPADFTCYRGDDGYGYLSVPTETGPSVQLLAGGIANRTLAESGNAALAMNVLGGQPRIVWLMAQDESEQPAGDEDPTLLPPWWQIGVVQVFLALVAVAIWRGRRLGPILVESLPVRVRASETVEGHGRLYQRLHARDRAAAALRAGVRGRLARRFAHADDAGALAETLARRTGRDPRAVLAVLDGPTPDTDDDLVALARTIDQLEQEARQL